MAGIRHINSKLIHVVDDWEELLLMGDPTVPMPEGVTAEEPLQLFIGRQVLETLLEQTLAKIHRNRHHIDHTAEDVADTDAMLSVRRKFLKWVRAHAGGNIFMSIHPVSEFVDIDDDTP